MVHVNCVNLIQQIQSYTFDMIEDKNARGDDLVVHLKYDINTLNITTAMWLTDEELKEMGGEEENDEQGIYGNGNEEDYERHLAGKIAEAFSPFKEFEGQEVEWEDGSGENFFGKTNFFN